MQRQDGEKRRLVLLRLPVLADLSLSTRLMLLVVVPLVLTMAVTLPLTVIGLNRLASETSNERLAGEVPIIRDRFEDFQFDLGQLADGFAADPVLLSGVRDSNSALIVSNLLAMRVRHGLEHVEVVDVNGISLGHEHEKGRSLEQSSLDDLNDLGLAGLDAAGLVRSTSGWSLTVVRPIKDSNGLIGAITVGQELGEAGLTALNFRRSDPLLLTIFEDNEVSAASYPTGRVFPVVVDPVPVEQAWSGQVVPGVVTVDGTDQRAVYAPLELGGKTVGVFAVALTTSPVVSLRDELAANQVMVAAALALLVLGVGYVVTRTITRRIMRLRNGAVELANGNLAVKVEETSRDEIGALAHEFNRMADNLREKTSQLELANKNLEMRVFERTDELERANAQLLDAQGQLVQTEKLAVIGELSAGVAHDLRNPLGAIRNGVFFLKSRLVKSNKLTTDPKIAEFLDVMDERITECDRIIGELIYFTRIAPPEYSTVPLSEALEQAMRDSCLPSDVAVERNFDDADVEIQGDHDQLVRVFGCLAQNAKETMPEGGKLTLAMRNDASQVEISFTDTGAGIDPEVVKRIFDPLYTTKIQGTGLGLALSQRIIEKHNGKLEASSRLGVGSTFTVRLPVKIGAAVGDGPVG
ncbi:MAG: ATP-binding protein [Chloroflexi bacterium]|nr:ATP-binding protein [Chloroflexota bacterium]MDA1271470.1 ATP-binding protein [Chloroflexota bacterium]